MSFGLQFKYLYHDVDIVELRIIIANPRFRGSADVYVGRGQLVEAAALLKGFPEHPNDTREIVLGAFGRQFAGGAVRLAFYCKDMAGHSAIEATIEADAEQFNRPDSPHIYKPECATIYVDFEPAALDEFIVELEQFEQEQGGSATLKTVQQ